MARRLFIFFAAMTLAAVAAAWLADRPGRVVIDWQTYRIETSFAAIVLLLVVLFFLLLLVLRLVRWLVSGRARTREWRHRRHQQKGEKALARGLTALAAGDAAQAEKHAAKADAYLADSSFVALLHAQAARLSGDSEKAAGYYKKLAGQPETDLLGLRGLLYQAIEAGDDEAAFKLASKAVSVRPRTAWALNALFDMSLSRGDWRGAERAVDGAVKAGIVSRETGKSQRAVIALLEARDKAQHGDWRGANKLARESHEARPDLVSAVTLAAESWIRQGKRKKAQHFIEKTWAGAPHPSVASLYRDTVKDLPAPEQVQKVESMVEGAKEHLESRLALAETAVDAGLWAVAREALKPCLETPTPRVARLMAAVAAGEGAAEAEREWLARAADTPHPDPRWRCRECGWEPADWEALCERCHSFDTVRWETPETALEAGGTAPPWRRLIEPGLIG